MPGKNGELATTQEKGTEPIITGRKEVLLGREQVSKFWEPTETPSRRVEVPREEEERNLTNKPFKDVKVEAVKTLNRIERNK